MASTLRHDSHPDHPLERITDINMTGASCRACDLPLESEKDPYGCRSCGFFLHRLCCFLETPLPNHPAHRQHRLLLLCTPANSREPYLCNICGKDGQGFRYHCQTCGHYNVHVMCTKLPQQQRVPAHRQHALQLLYPPLDTERTCASGCGRPIQHACYGCSGCSFFLHPKCLRRNPMIGSPSYQQTPTAAGVSYQQAPTAAGVSYQQAPTAAGVPFNPQQAPASRPQVNWAYLGLGFVSNIVGGFLGLEGSDVFGCDGLEGDGALENHDVQAWDDGCEGDTFDCYADGTLQAEAASLAFLHMESMGGESTLEDLGNGVNELPGSGSYGDPFEDEATALAFAHMNMMG